MMRVDGKPEMQPAVNSSSAALSFAPCCLPASDQILLKLIELPAALPSQPIAPSVLSAMQRLIDIVDRLRSSAETAGESGVDGADGADLSAAPEALTLYVSEEAQDVLDALQDFALPLKQDTLCDTVLPSLEQFPWRGYFRLSFLASWLLWGSVRSSDAVMQLLEGRIANCLGIDRTTWQTGILRLVSLFSLHTPAKTHTLDLATEQPGIEPLAADRLLHFESTLGQQPVMVGELLDRLSQQIQITTPAIVPFLQGVAAELFIPQSPWQAGSIQLHYALEFTPLSQPLLPTSTLSLPRLKFTDRTWQQQYQTLIKDQQLTSLLSCQSDLLPGQPLPGLASLVHCACAVSGQLQTGTAFASRCFVTQELNLSELATRLHWCLIHSAYAVMQFLSGVSATLWLPGSACKTGTLRFLLYLRMQTPESDWILDLATGQALTNSRSTLPSEAIVQSQESSWCEQPCRLGDLESMFWQQVYRSLPEFKLLLQGTEIDLLNNSQDWQPGVIQLQGNFEFKDRG